jgi:osmoprotectant transport system substrate-binding protein
MAPKLRNTRVLAGAIVALLALTACGADFGPVQPNGIALTIGSQSGFDNKVVAEIYGQALEQRGYEVDYNTGIGSRKSYIEALQSGVLDMVPDYAGLLLGAVNESADDRSIDTIMTALPVALDPLDLTVLDASKATKSRVFVVTHQFADAHSIVKIADLAPVASAISIGSAERLESASYGRRTLEFTYGVADWAFRSAPDDATALDDLLENNVQVADLSTTDPAIIENDLVELADPETIITAQNLVPVLRGALVTSEFASIVNEVTAQLTTNDLAHFSTIDDELPSTVARQWLIDKGIIVVDTATATN